MSDPTQDPTPRTAPAIVGRRTLVAGAAWSIPVMAVATAVPLAAASACPTAEFDAAFVTNSDSGSVKVLNATSPDTADTYTVRITSTLAPGTTTTQNGQSYNFSQNGSGWNGDFADDGSGDYTYSGFGPAGAIVLNQRKEGTTAPIGPGTDSQTLTFEFFDASGAAISATNVAIDIFDITSVEVPAWRASYWDAVGFSVTPASIVSEPTLDQGAGTGTLADPFRRSGGLFPTNPMEQAQYQDEFRFDSFPNGSTMDYTSFNGNQGWHFIAVSSIRFTAQIAC
ncbi:hypothetical protein HDC34_001792 [Pseudoclavibacter sp. JAI123]|uniref:hypothetical protein n=1 Tax=Pseudoclavibacter sp. JAI123 TaxID=2723065 RepID=UPI0015C6B28D|nr:hypothetical protein [Pseudoclavibacter sp. JAI123]NYF13498.1 hypothetical protein [Pseudoclavibacter sp. JAI123]